MASPARPASVSGPFGLAPDLARCSFDHTLHREVSSPVCFARSPVLLLA